MDSNLILFNIAYIKLSTRIEGPFTRCCIWFQGCNLNCNGCSNKDLQSFIPNHIVTLEKLVSIVKKAKDEYGIEGVTLSGGEPSLQKDLIYFNNEMHKLGLGVIMFSGKTKKELDKNLVKSVDLLIDGPFLKNQKDTSRLLLGSKNKKLYFITERYKNEVSYFYNPVSIDEVVVGDYIFINGD